MASVPVPVDSQGIDVEALAATDARVVIVTPAHHWPTGVVLAPRRRLALIDWAVRRDAVIIEDDYDAEFRYDRDPVGALQGLAPDRVISAGTVSWSLAPALRIGWLLCPPGIGALVTEHKHLSDRGSPTLDQLALATLIESGRYDRRLRRMRARYATRRTALVAALAEHAPQVAVTGRAAGFHTVAHLGPAADERAVVAAARAVGLYGMSTCRASRATAPPQLVLGRSWDSGRGGTGQGQCAGAVGCRGAARVAEHDQGLSHDHQDQSLLDGERPGARGDRGMPRRVPDACRAVRHHTLRAGGAVAPTDGELGAAGQFTRRLLQVLLCSGSRQSAQYLLEERSALALGEGDPGLDGAGAGAARGLQSVEGGDASGMVGVRRGLVSQDCLHIAGG